MYHRIWNKLKLLLGKVSSFLILCSLILLLVFYVLMILFLLICLKCFTSQYYGGPQESQKSNKALHLMLYYFSRNSCGPVQLSAQTNQSNVNRIPLLSIHRRKCYTSIKHRIEIDSISLKTSHQVVFLSYIVYCVSCWFIVRHQLSISPLFISDHSLSRDCVRTECNPGYKERNAGPDERNAREIRKEQTRNNKRLTVTFFYFTSITLIY